MIRLLTFALTTFLLFNFSQAQDSTEYNKHIPEWASKVLESDNLFQSYEIIDSINPFYFEADFTGDEKIDIAFIVKSKLSGDVGTYIINGGKNVSFVMGAGKPIGMGNSIDWCDNWFVYRKKYIYNFTATKKKFIIQNPALEFRKTDERSIVVYWDKRRYKSAILNVK
ncbi:MAG: hypothetical protein P8P74_15420 [Crocinitomicaceae bacterium]|nr:hypothetical protein [Crocinitomicaceae bacterium]